MKHLLSAIFFSVCVCVCARMCISSCHSSPLCIWSLCVALASLSTCTTVLYVYTILTGNGCVFTLELIVSPHRLLLSTMLRTCLSAAVGCFKAGDTIVSELVSTWVFVFQRCEKRKEVLLSGQCGVTQLWSVPICSLFRLVQALLNV